MRDILRAVRHGTPSWLPFNYHDRSQLDEIRLVTAERYAQKDKNRTIEYQDTYNRLMLDILSDLRYIQLTGLTIKPAKVGEYLRSLPSNRNKEPQQPEPPAVAKVVKLDPTVNREAWLKEKI